MFTFLVMVPIVPDDATERVVSPVLVTVYEHVPPPSDRFPEPVKGVDSRIFSKASSAQALANAFALPDCSIAKLVLEAPTPKRTVDNAIDKPTAPTKRTETSVINPVSVLRIFLFLILSS